MKLRPLQLVCLAMLLATLRLADPAALAPGDFALRAGVLNALLGSELTEHDWTITAKPQRRADGIVAPRRTRATPTLPGTSATLLHARWTMPPPAHQSAAVQSFTGFLRA